MCLSIVCVRLDWWIQGAPPPKKMAQFLYALTLPNINRFLKIFYCQNQENICNSVSLQYLVKCQWHPKQRNRRDSSLGCLGPHFRLDERDVLTPQVHVRQCVPGSVCICNIWSIEVDDSRQSTSWSRRSSLSGANCRSVSLIVPLVSGVAGLSVSYSSKADTLNIWCKNCRMWQLL